jgi:hypothetical protein
VAPHATLVEPASPEALAAAIAALYRAPEVRAKAAREGLGRVEAYDAPRVAELFLQAAVGTSPMLSGTPA